MVFKKVAFESELSLFGLTNQNEIMKSFKHENAKFDVIVRIR